MLSPAKMYTKEYTGVPKKPFPRGRANRLPSLACSGFFALGKRVGWGRCAKPIKRPGIVSPAFDRSCVFADTISTFSKYPLVPPLKRRKDVKEDLPAPRLHSMGNRSADTPGNCPQYMACQTGGYEIPTAALQPALLHPAPQGRS